MLRCWNLSEVISVILGGGGAIRGFNLIITVEMNDFVLTISETPVVHELVFLNYLIRLRGQRDSSNSIKTQLFFVKT